MKHSLDKYFYLRIALMAGYVCILVLAIIFHEPWRDEGQVWLIARDLNWWQLFLQSGAEGHPFVWHFILKPFTGLPYYPTISIVNLIFTLAGIYLLLFKTSIPLLISGIMVYTPVMMEYGSVARNYGVCLFFLTSTAVLYPKRFEKPILYALVVGLLTNSIIVSGVIGTGMAIAFWYDSYHKYPSLDDTSKKRLNTALIISYFFTLLFALQIMLMIFVHGKGRLPWLAFADIPHAFIATIAAFLLILYLHFKIIIERKFLVIPKFTLTKRFTAFAVIALIITFVGIGPIDKYSPEFSTGFIDMRILIIFLTGYLIFFKDMSVLTLSLTGIAMVMIGIVFEEGYTKLGLRHTSIYIVQSLIYFSAHVEVARKRFVTNTVALLLFFSCSPIFSLVLFYAEITMIFSGAPAAALYIKEQGLDNKDQYLIAVPDTAMAGGVAPYFNDKKVFYFPNTGNYGTFSNWKIPRWTRITNAIESDKDVIYMSEKPLPLDNNNLYWDTVTNFPGVVESIGFYRLKNK